MPQVTQETLDLVKGAITGDDISKSITTATGLAAYDLQAPAKNLYPIFTPLRNKIPRVGGGKGVATNWKQITSIVGSGFDSTGWVPEGQRSGRMSYTSAPKAANYVTLGEEDSVTFEAVNAGKTFEDVRASMTVRLLQKLMLKEENAILGGNSSLSLTAPGAPTVSASGSGATLPAATYNVYVVALTQEGYFNSSLTAGVATSKLITGADGGTYTIYGGSSNKSAVGSASPTLGQNLLATVSAVTGAVAYAWYVGTAGAETLQAITTTNALTISAPLAGSRQAATAVTANSSNNPGLAYNGLLTTALNSGTAYVSTLATNNSGLTATGSGSIVEIDTMLRQMWDTYQLSPTVIYCNSQEIQNITNKVMAVTGGSLLNINRAANEPHMVVAGGVIAGYFNPFMPNGGALIPVLIHPKVPPGTLLSYCEQLPAYYQNNEVSNVAEIKTRQDYYQIDWPIRTRMYETGVYSENVLAVYCPFAVGVITNITNA